MNRFMPELGNWLLQMSNIHNFKLLLESFHFLFVFSILLCSFFLLILSGFYYPPNDQHEYLDSEKAY